MFVPTVEELPVVGALSAILEQTAKTASIALLGASLIGIVIMLVWSHMSDRETGRWWKALIVWLIAAALVTSATVLTGWSKRNLSPSASASASASITRQV